MYIEDLAEGGTFVDIIYKESEYSLIGKTVDGRLVSFDCDALHIGNRVLIQKSGKSVRFLVIYGLLLPPKEPR